VAREACTNAVRHARAQRVSLRFAVEDGAATLSVIDDGAGCGAAAQPADMAAPQLPRAADGAGHGVAGMAERIHVLGGSFSAGDGENGGFCVRASIPLRGTEA
ncbi:MAG: ATP-binding protein, partial [Senegalimassilia sp.]|nr:ATP-binding protein [Senegalimassilia sp.]